MPLKLTWKDRNVASDGTRIYRSTAPMNPASLPAPIGTVGPGVMEFVDETLEQNKVYYYRFESFKGADKTLSDEKILGAYPYTGPGLQQPLRGNFKDGYFGSVPNADMFTDSELMSASGSGGTRTGAVTKWFKYAIDGKILFLPDGPIAYNLTWEQLYQRGLVYGVAGTGTAPSPVGSPVNQMKTVTKNEHQFIVRLPVGTNNPDEVSSAAGRPTDQSEWDRMHYPTVMAQSDFRMKWDDLTASDMQKGHSAILCADLGTTSAARSTRGGPSTVSGLSAIVTTTSGYWKPVLQLVL